MRDVMMGLKEDVQRLDALLRLVGERLTRAVEPPALLDKRDVAARLNVSVRQVDRLVAAGVLRPALRLGSSPRWRPEQLEAFCLSGSSKRRGGE